MDFLKDLSVFVCARSVRQICVQKIFSAKIKKN
jgi:hypothetical protein